MRIVGLFLLPFSCVAVCVAEEFTPEVRVKPNIILVFIDDMGYSDFSCFGNAIAKTPQIDTFRVTPRML